MTSNNYADAYQNGGYQRTLKFLKTWLTHDQAQDLAQAAWIRGWERLGQLRDERRITDWVNVIARNLMVSSLRCSRPVEQFGKDEPAGAPEQNLAAIDARRILQACSPRQRRLLQRVYLDECPCADVARELGISIAAVHSGLLRARRVVRKQLNVTSS
jgi:RNA polymerase sigma-70 factor, ECF subfamily